MSSAGPAPWRLLTLPRSEAEELRIDLAEYEGRPYVSFRLWFKSSTDGGWHPTRQGVTVRLREITSVLRALDQPEVRMAGGRRYAKPARKPEEIEP